MGRRGQCHWLDPRTSGDCDDGGLNPQSASNRTGCLSSLCALAGVRQSWDRTTNRSSCAGEGTASDAQKDGRDEPQHDAGLPPQPLVCAAVSSTKDGDNTRSERTETGRALLKGTGSDCGSTHWRAPGPGTWPVMAGRRQRLRAGWCGRAPPRPERRGGGRTGCRRAPETRV